jgi:hypothetical protein
VLEGLTWCRLKQIEDFCGPENSVLRSDQEDLPGRERGNDIHRPYDRATMSTGLTMGPTCRSLSRTFRSSDSRWSPARLHRHGAISLGSLCARTNHSFPRLPTPYVQEYRPTDSRRFERSASRDGHGLYRYAPIVRGSSRCSTAHCHQVRPLLKPLDLKPNNILIRPEQIESIITTELLDNPTLTKRNRPHYLPKGLIRDWSQPIPPWLNVSKHIVGDIGLEVALVDLGHGELFKSVRSQKG